MDENSEERKIDEAVLKDIKELEDVKKLVATTKKQVKSITIGGVEVKIMAAIPRPIRARIDIVGQTIRTGEVVTPEIEKELYQIMAELCIEAPWKNPLTWEYIDNETGETPRVFTKIIETMYSDELRAANFRPGPGRSSPPNNV
jgi:hypothetical protein